MGIKHTVNAPEPNDPTKTVSSTAWNTDHAIDGDVDFAGHAITNVVVNATGVMAATVNATDATVADEAYSASGWNGSLEVPTKNAVRNKIESLILSGGGGVTDFLALDDTPDTYVNASAGLGPFLRVSAAENALEFKYSTANYIDIRDYGTVVGSGGDITAAFQAALNATSSAEVFRVRIPCVGNGVYVCGSISFPVGNPVIVEFDCQEIGIYGTTWQLKGGHKYIGKRHFSQNFPHPYGPMPGAWLYSTGAHVAGTPLIAFNTETMFHIENMRVSCHNGPACKITGGELGTVKNCQFGTDSLTYPALNVDCGFWIQFHNLSCSSGLSVNSYSIDFNTASNLGLNCGLMMLRDINVFRQGIRFKATYGPSGVGNFTINRLHMEGVIDGGALVTFDSTANLVGEIDIHRCEMSDPVGSTYYVLKNTGVNTNGITINSRNGISIDPSGDAIGGLVLDHTTPSVDGSYFHEHLGAQFVGTHRWANWSTRTADWIDATLACTPVGLPWTVGTPINLEQNPANWIPTGGQSVTPVLAPDGSMEAALVSGGGGITIYSGPTLTYAVGDWFLTGIWLRNPSGGAIKGNGTWIETLGHPNLRFNGSFGSGSRFTDFYLHDNQTNAGWQWRSAALKVTSIGTNPAPFSVRLGATGCEYFNPCLIRFAAGTVDDAWIINTARSLKGGWSSNGTAGNVALLDHQLLQLGGAAGGSARGGVQANKIITPRAAALTIATGAITVTGSYHAVDTEAAAASDDLDTINGGVAGYRLVLRAANSSRTVVCKDGTNLKLAGDFNLDNTEDTIELIYDATLAAWLEIGRSDNGA